jgi:hypothetical protein
MCKCAARALLWPLFCAPTSFSECLCFAQSSPGLAPKRAAQSTPVPQATAVASIDSSTADSSGGGGSKVVVDVATPCNAATASLGGASDGRVEHGGARVAIMQGLRCSFVLTTLSAADVNGGDAAGRAQR